MVLLSSGRSNESRTNLRLFGGAAMAVGVPLYAGVALVGSVLPWSGGAAFTLTIIGGAVGSACWYAVPALRWLPSTNRQVRRSVALIPLVGAVVFGGVFGAGILTVVVTPLVWIGLAVTFLSGSVVWGATYGAAFALGRITQLLLQYHEGAAEPVSVIHRIMLGQGLLLQRLAIAGSAVIAVVEVTLAR
jgi:hypothetical protein